MRTPVNALRLVAHGLGSVGETFVEFFRWLGVADAPRVVRLDRAALEDEFTSYVQINLPEGTFVIGGYQFRRATDFKGYCTGVLTLDDLPKRPRPHTSCGITW